MSERKPREWWIYFKQYDTLVMPTKEAILAAYPEPINPTCNIVHTQEVIPDSITITREEFRAALSRAKVLEPDATDIEQELFGKQ